MILGSSNETLAQIAGLGVGLLSLRYSRDHEYEADDMGRRLSFAANYDPRGNIQFFEKLMAKYEKKRPSSIEVMIDDEDSAMTSLLEEAGFSPLADKGASAWMSAVDHPTISPTPAGYTLASRSERGSTPHHFIARNGPDVADRLEQTSLYRADLDLAMLDAASEVAAYGLFWFDPTTQTGFLEPMGSNEGHQRKGLALHILTSGVDRLVQAGATRIKINWEQDNEASSNLYLDVGFAPVMTTSLWVRN